MNGVKVCANSAVLDAPHLVITILEDEINFNIFFSNSKT